ncbi:MAG TPA: 2'-deoxycytidine 5'-triphosphate deaminase [Candidatus Saccharimonadales bacterium]|jgi:dCTP deaminase|nr:2'-deoxycytidine 5'-triphosphate deaminase [Candidatus Saccharimonadales bacterium]
MSTPEMGGKLSLFSDWSEEPAATSRSEGMLPSQEIRELIANGHIRAFPEIKPQQVQPASLDLRLGGVGYRVQASFIPQNSTVERGIADAGLSMSRVDLTRTTVFEKGCVYIVPLLEELHLPDEISASANPKSSTGRLDIFTRLITDYGTEFEKVKRGYKGKLYAEIASRTFTVIVREGMALNQLRFVRGNPKSSDTAISRLEKTALAEDSALIYGEEGNPEKAQIDKQSLKLSVNLRAGGPTEVVAYKARKNAPVIDLANLNHYAPEDFWELRHDSGKRGLILEAGDFYILASKEKVSVPPDWAAEMVPMDQDIGEFRIHYAGFFDPGFGYGAGDVRGTRAVLEVRAHEVPFLIEHGQIMGRLKYIPLRSRPDKIYGMDIGSSYQRQGLALSKHFKKA